jgi:hypothetical protein
VYPSYWAPTSTACLDCMRACVCRQIEAEARQHLERAGAEAAAEADCLVVPDELETTCEHIGEFVCVIGGAAGAA